MTFSTAIAGFLALLQIASPTSQEEVAEKVIPVKANSGYVRQHRPLQKPSYQRQAPKYKLTQTVSEPIRLFDDEHYAAQLDDRMSNILVVNGPADPQHCKSLVAQTLQALPDSHTKTLKNLELNFSTTVRRGLTNANTMKLRCANVSDSVLVAVLIHEIGHLVDLGQFRGSLNSGKSEFTDFGQPIYNNDLSVAFYRISWINESTKRPGASAPLDFVSGYAMTDPFEDFAEAYHWYILHGPDFRKLATNNEILEQKYTFLKTYVFDNKEFDGKVTIYDNFKRVYDSTLLPYSLRKFFNNKI